MNKQISSLKLKYEILLSVTFPIGNFIGIELREDIIIIYIGFSSLVSFFDYMELYLINLDNNLSDYIFRYFITIKAFLFGYEILSLQTTVFML